MFPFLGSPSKHHLFLFFLCFVVIPNNGCFVHKCFGVLTGHALERVLRFNLSLFVICLAFLVYIVSLVLTMLMVKENTVERYA